MTDSFASSLVRSPTTIAGWLLLGTMIILLATAAFRRRAAPRQRDFLVGLALTLGPVGLAFVQWSSFLFHQDQIAQVVDELSSAARSDAELSLAQLHDAIGDARRSALLAIVWTFLGGVRLGSLALTQLGRASKAAPA